MSISSDVRERLANGILNISEMLQFVDMFYLVQHALPRVHSCLIELNLLQEADEWQKTSELLIDVIGGGRGSKSRSSSSRGVNAFLKRMCDVRDLRNALLGIRYSKTVHKKWKKLANCIRQRYQQDVDDNVWPEVPRGSPPTPSNVNSLGLLDDIPMFPYL